jgi:glucosamine-6-phosphate deaminase
MSIRVSNYANGSKAAELVTAAIVANPSISVVAAVGATPMGAYRELARRRSEFDVSRIRVFQLDEYLGISESDPRSLYAWLHRSLLERLGLGKSQVVRLRGDAAEPEAASRAYEAAVREVGGFDQSVLGPGPNGHLGFNEPPVEATAPTRAVELTPESLESNAAYWGARDRVPAGALTAGMDLLLAARKTLLLVSGAHKREILRRTLEEPCSPDVPASFLHASPNVTVLADRKAAP